MTTATKKPTVNNRTKLLAAVAVVVLLATAPSWAPIDSSGTLKQAAASDRDQAATLNKQADEASTVSSDPAGFEARRDAMTVAVPDGPDLPGLIDSIGRTAARVGLDWTTATPSRTSTEGAAYQTWSVNITVTGERARLPLFFDELRTMQRYVTVESITYQQITDTVVSVVATIHFYSLNTDDAPAAAADGQGATR